jgi:hypothetical protein
MNAMVHVNGVRREIESEIRLESIWNVVANASHDHDPLSIIRLEVGDGESARHNPQKYQMVKHQLV